VGVRGPYVAGRTVFPARRTDGGGRLFDDQEPGVPRSHLDVAASFDAPASAAWKLLTDTRAWPRWGPTITAVDTVPPVIEAGSRGRLRTPVGLWLPFAITAFEPGARWSWRVAGVPATGHRVEATPGGCRIVFEVPIVTAPYAAVCRVALRRLGELLAADPS
jgi:hypothetical protein